MILRYHVRMMDFRLYLILGVLASLLCVTGFSVDGEHFPTGKPKRCTRSKLSGKVVYDCHGMDLTTIPSNLRTDVQALDVSFNRIRELRSGCFEQYTSVELLYLWDNAIAHIDDDVFEPLQNLQVVDLSLNAIQVVPAQILTLPNLWKFDMSQNKLRADGLEAFKSSSPSGHLKWLSLAQCDLTELPPLDAFPLLMHLNVSGNALLKFTIAQLAPACSLKVLDLSGVRVDFSQCDCLTLHHWIQEDEIVISPTNTVNCTSAPGAPVPLTAGTTSPAMCSMQEVEDIRCECKKAIIAKIQKEKREKIWTIVGVVLAVVIGIILIAVFWVRRRRNNRLANLHTGNNNNTNGNSEKQTLDQSENKLLTFSP